MKTALRALPLSLGFLISGCMRRRWQRRCAGTSGAASRQHATRRECRQRPGGRPRFHRDLNGGGSSDANGTIATYAWTQTGGAAVTIASGSTATPSFTAPAAAGALAFQLTVTDNGGASHSDSVTVTVNAIPVANAGADQTVSAGAAVSLAGSATDADGTITNYSWTQTGGTAVTLSNANGATATFTAPSAAATLTFNLVATDNRGATHSDSVSVTVNAVVVNPPPPASPVIARQPNHPLALEHGSAMMFVHASGENLTYEWRRATGAVMKTGPEASTCATV